MIGILVFRRNAFLLLPLGQVAANELQRRDSHLDSQHHKIDDEQQDQRDHCRQHKCLRIEQNFVSGQAVACEVLVGEYLFQPCVPQHISHNCGNQQHQHRHDQIMPHHFSAGITGSTKRTNDIRFLGDVVGKW